MANDNIQPNPLMDGLKKIGEALSDRNVMRYRSGLFQEPINEPVPNYNSATNEEILSGNNNTWIIMGRDRPRGKATGKGSGISIDQGATTTDGGGATSLISEPSTHNGRIDIIAGMSGIFAREENIEGKKVATDPSPELDAARIYISQRCSIDTEEYWNLAAGSIGIKENTSAIVLCSDSTRIIGREGIKLVTGNHNYSGAAGFFIGDGIDGIDLIAGNDDTLLEPIAKARTLQKALDDIIDLIYHLHGHVYYLYQKTEAAKMIPVDGGMTVIITEVEKQARMKMLRDLDLEYTLTKWNYAGHNPVAPNWFGSTYNNTN